MLRNLKNLNRSQRIVLGFSLVLATFGLFVEIAHADQAATTQPKIYSCGKTIDECEANFNEKVIQFQGANKELAAYRALLAEANEWIASHFSPH